MRGFKPINEFTLKECADYLAQNEGGAYVEEVKARYKVLLEEMAKQEEADFKACTTIADYEKFIAKYKSKSVEPYRAKHLDDAEKAKQRLASEDKQREEERLRREREERRREQQRAEERRRKRKRTFLIVLASLVVVAVAVFFIGYRPVKFLTANDVVFGKEGGQQSLRVETNVSRDAISIRCPSDDWITVDLDGYMIGISATPNPDPERSCVIEVRANSTIYGNPIGSPMKQNIVVKQGSGYASNLKLSTKNLNVGKYGETRQVNIKTDGVGLGLSSNAGWIHATPKNQSHDGQYYHDDDYEIVVDKNPGDYRSGTITVSSNGQPSQEIIITQASGLANTFYVSSTSINNVGKSGNTFYVDITTDGTTWDANTNYSWLDLTEHNGYLEIKVSSTDEVRDGYVYVSSNNGHKQTISIHQDGAPTSFYASKSSWTFDTGSDYDYISINNNSNQSMYASADKSWLSASISGGKVRIACERNDNSPRDGTVTVSCGSKTCSIKVHQKGWTTCWQCGGNGQVACDNYRAIWTSDNWGNWGHGYVSYDGWGNRYVSVCEVCGGSGRKTCSNCDGKGKVKSN